jgi:hypothetical protein
LIALRKEILHIGICYLEGRRRAKVNKYFVNFADSWATTPLIQNFIDWTGVERKRWGAAMKVGCRFPGRSVSSFSEASFKKSS